MRCRVCNHSERDAIESSSETRDLAVVAELFGLSESALERHVQLHSRLFAVASIVAEPIPPTLPSAGQVAA